MVDAICIWQSHGRRIARTHTDTRVDASCSYSDGTSTPAATTTNKALEGKQTFGARFIDKQTADRQKTEKKNYNKHDQPHHQFIDYFSGFVVFVSDMVRTLKIDPSKFSRLDAGAGSSIRICIVRGAFKHIYAFGFQPLPTQCHTELISRSSFTQFFFSPIYMIRCCCPHAHTHTR